MLMKRYITYDESEITKKIQGIKNILEEIGNFYGMVHEQLEKKRENVSIELVRKEYEKLEKIDSKLNELGLIDDDLKSLDKVLKELKKARKSDMY